MMMHQRCSDVDDDGICTEIRIFFSFLLSILHTCIHCVNWLLFIDKLITSRDAEFVLAAQKWRTCFGTTNVDNCNDL